MSNPETYGSVLQQEINKLVDDVNELKRSIAIEQKRLVDLEAELADAVAALEDAEAE
jgi:hypothetical protein